MNSVLRMKKEKRARIYLAGNIVLLFLLQIASTLFYKWGSTASHLYWWGFVLGNLAGISSTLLLINIYKKLNPNLTLAIIGGGGFLISQTAMAIVYGHQMGLPFIVGIVMIVGGIMMMAFFLERP